MISLIKNEFFKQKRNYFYLIVIMLPILFGLILYPLWIVRGSEFMYNDAAANGFTPWQYLIKQSHILYMPDFLPIYIAILGYLIFDIEVKNNHWKYILSAPLKKKQIFTSKALMLFACGFFIVTVNLISLIIAGKLIGISDSIDINYFVKVWVYRVAICGVIVSIQGLVSVYSNKISIILGIPFIGYIISNMFFGKESIINNINPYGFFSYCDDIYLGGDFNNITMIFCIVITILLVLISSNLFEKKDIC